MKAAIYPGSFDPMTLGHLDVIRRASKMFDTLIVSVLDNKAKNALFSVEERVSILKEATKDLPNVQVDSFQGLLIDYARQKIFMCLSEDFGLLQILNMSFRLHRLTASYPMECWIRYF